MLFIIYIWSLLVISLKNNVTFNSTIAEFGWFGFRCCIMLQQVTVQKNKYVDPDHFATATFNGR